MRPVSRASETSEPVISEIPRVLRGVVNGYLHRCGVKIVLHLDAIYNAWRIKLWLGHQLTTWSLAPTMLRRQLDT
jgi:hypothetical protein